MKYIKNVYQLDKNKYFTSLQTHQVYPINWF